MLGIKNMVNMKTDINEGIRAALKAVNKKYDIIQLDLEELEPSEDNFYEVSNIKALAGNIKDFGLQQNIVVMKRQGKKYEIIAGHRRYKAFQILFQDGNQEYGSIPCRILETMSDTLKNLLLIHTNGNTRVKKSWEITEEVVRLNILYADFRKENQNFKGRTDEAIAEELGMSSTNVGRHKKIDKKLTFKLKDLYKQDKLKFSIADELAGLSEKQQEEVFKIYELKNEITLKNVADLKREDSTAQDHQQEDLKSLKAKGQTVLDGCAKESDSEATTEKQEKPEEEKTVTNSQEDYYDKYGRIKPTKYDRTQQYVEYNKVIDIKDNRLPDGGFRLYLVQDKEDRLWRSSAARGFIEVGAVRYPHRDADNPANSKLYPAFKTAEESLQDATKKMFWFCNAEQKEILESMGYTNSIETKSEKSYRDMTPCEQCRSANRHCGDNHCCKTCEDTCNGQQICRLDNPPEKQQEKIDEWNRKESEHPQNANYWEKTIEANEWLIQSLEKMIEQREDWKKIYEDENNQDQVATELERIHVMMCIVDSIKADIEDLEDAALTEGEDEENE